MKGRGTGIQHRRTDEERRVPVFGFDYLLGTRDAAEDQESQIKILVAKCQFTKCTFAHVVPQKGMDPDLYAVKRLTRDILWLGHNKIILKSDNERAIISVLRNTIKALRIENIENTQEVHPAVYDSSSNASTESTCKQVAGMIRTLKSCLEDRIKMRIPTSHSVFAWLVEHAAWMLTTRTTHSDGITAYKRLRGRNFPTRLLAFGEKCLYKINQKQPKRSMDGKMSPRWKEGVFL